LSRTKQKLTFVEKKKAAIKGEAKQKSLAATSYRELLRSIRNMNEKTAKINVPLLYKLLRNQGLDPNTAREKLTNDCWFWSDRWIREFLPEEAKRTEMARIKKDHEDAKKELSSYEYPDDNDTPVQRESELDKQIAESEKAPPLYLAPGEKATMAKTILEFNPRSHDLYVFPKSNSFDSMLRDHPEIEQNMIEDLMLTHDGTRITKTTYALYSQDEKKKKQ